MRKILLASAAMTVLAGCAHDRVITEYKSIYIYPPSVDCPDEPKIPIDPQTPPFMDSDVRDYIVQLRKAHEICHSSKLNQDDYTKKMKEREKADPSADRTISPKLDGTKEDVPIANLDRPRGAVGLASL